MKKYFIIILGLLLIFSYGCTKKITPTQPSPTAPDAPTNLQATAASTTQVNISWTDNSTNEDGFKIERKTGLSGVYAEVKTLPADAASWSDTGLGDSTVYYYKIRGYNAVGNSGYSNEASVTTPAVGQTAPVAPSNLQATAVSSSQINLSWTDNSSNESGFRIELPAALYTLAL